MLVCPWNHLLFLCDYHWFQGDSVKVTFIGANPRNNVKVHSYLPLIIFLKAHLTVRKCNLFTNLCVPYISVGGHLPVSGDASTRQQLEGSVYRQSVGNKVSPYKDCNSFATCLNNLLLSSFNSYNADLYLLFLQRYTQVKCIMNCI